MREVVGGILSAIFVATHLYAAPPQIWFEPLDPYTRQSNVTQGLIPPSLACCSDYMSLFSPGAPWAQAASNLSVFALGDSQVLNTSDSDLQAIFAFLNQHNIATAVVFSALVPPADRSCGIGVEGFSGPLGQNIASKVKADGGVLKYVAFDSPYYFGSIYNGASACHWSGQQIATNLLTNITALRSVFPGVIIGEIEATPPDKTLAPNWVALYASWLDTFQSVTGNRIAFYQADASNANPSYNADLNAIRAETTKRNIPFGILYDGTTSDSSDQEWVTHASQAFLQYELNSPPPDQAFLISWMAYPLHNLPETTPYTFSWLIDQYARQRPTLTLNASPTQAAGTLNDGSGKAMAGVPISVSLQPNGGEGVLSTFSFTGTVPPQAAQALIGLRINEECNCSGNSDLLLYGFEYSEGSAQSNKVTLNFSHGLQNWGLYTTGTTALETPPGAPGQGVHFTDTPTQVVQLNSSLFNVTPNASYTVKMTAQVAPKSVGSGYDSILFAPNGSWSGSRDVSALQNVSIALGDTQTASDGSFSLPFVSPAGGSFVLQASFAGTNIAWPAQATSPLSIQPAIKTNGIVNAASFQAQPLSPGTWFTIFGYYLGNAGQWTNANTFSLGGTSITICGTPAAISYNSGPVNSSSSVAWQLNALVPDSVAGQSSCAVTATVNGQLSAPANVSITKGNMEIFPFSVAGVSAPVITHADYSLVGPVAAGLTPARPGEQVIAWGTGDCSTPSVTVGGNSATVTFSGRTEPGLCQLNFVVPSGTAGASNLKISSSSQSYTMAVAQ